MPVDPYLHIINLFAFIALGILQRVSDRKATKARTAATIAIGAAVAANKQAADASESASAAINQSITTNTQKLEVVHKLVNNAASEQQAKVDALETELREMRRIVDRLTARQETKPDAG